MKSKLFPILVVLGVLVLVGCDDDNCIFNPVPAAPQGVYSITGDGAVYLFWNGPYEGDIVEYIIWRSFEPKHNYTEVGRREAEPNEKLDLIYYDYVDRNDVQNGATYYYAVSSVDRAGQVSELSAEEVFDTPRPEGRVILFVADIEPGFSGYHFADSSRVDSSLADVFVDRFDGVLYLNAGNDYTHLQDMGYTDSLDEINYAPEYGWSQVGWVVITPGHMYVIWTDDGHFAKMRAESINFYYVTFDWAYQTAPDNPELAPRLDGREKPVHGSGYLRKDNKSTTLK